MNNFNPFSVTFPEVRKYRLADWMEKHFAVAFSLLACLAVVVIGPSDKLSVHLVVVAAAALVMFIGTRYGMSLKRRMSPALNAKLREAIYSNTGLMLPEGFPIAMGTNVVPLSHSDGRAVSIRIERHGDLFTISESKQWQPSSPLIAG